MEPHPALRASLSLVRRGKDFSAAKSEGEVLSEMCVHRSRRKQRRGLRGGVLRKLDIIYKFCLTFGYEHISVSHNNNFGSNDNNFGSNDNNCGSNDSNFGSNDSNFGSNDNNFGSNDNNFGSAIDLGMRSPLSQQSNDDLEMRSHCF